MEKNTVKQKLDEMKAKAEEKAKVAKEGVKEFVEWVKENPGYGIPLVLTGLGVAKGVFNTGRKAIDTGMELRKRDRQYYDPSLGMYLDLKKKLTKGQLIELDARRKKGESIIGILNDMNVLK